MKRPFVIKCNACKGPLASYAEKAAGKYFSKRSKKWLLLCGICRDKLTKSLNGNAKVEEHDDCTSSANEADKVD